MKSKFLVTLMIGIMFILTACGETYGNNVNESQLVKTTHSTTEVTTTIPEYSYNSKTTYMFLKWIEESDVYEIKIVETEEKFYFERSKTQVIFVYNISNSYFIIENGVLYIMLAI